MSVNSLQGVRGLMTLSHEKREDGLSTPRHAASDDEEADLSPSQSPKSSTAASTSDNVTTSTNSSNNKVKKDSLKGPPTTQKTTQVENPNRHLTISDLQTDFLPMSFASSSVSTPVLPSVESSTVTASLSDPVLSAAELSANVSAVISDTQKWREEQEAKLQAQLREMKRAHRRQLGSQQRAMREAELAHFDQTAQAQVDDDVTTDGNINDDHDDIENRVTERKNDSSSERSIDENTGLQEELRRLKRKTAALRETSASATRPVGHAKVVRSSRMFLVIVVCMMICA